jgi:hypothetical protein
MNKKESVETELPAWLVRCDDWRRRNLERLERFLQLRIVRIPLRVTHKIIRIYLLAGGVVLAGLIAVAIEERGQKPDSQLITLPAMPGRGPAGRLKSDGSFRHGLDSIRSNEVLRREFDSLMTARPGFADSIRQLEELYGGKELFLK